MVLSRFDMLQGAAGDVKELEYISCLHQTDLRGGIRKNASIQAADVRLFLQSRHGIAGPGRPRRGRRGSNINCGFLTDAMVRKVIFSGLQADATEGAYGNDDDDDDAAAAAGNGDDDDDDDSGQTQPCLDLMEIVAILLIPTLLKAYAALAGESSGTYSNMKLNGGAGDTGIIPAPPGMLEFVLSMILHDVVGDRGENENNNDNDSFSKSLGTMKNKKNIIKPPALTKDLVRSILVAYGEYQLALDEALLQEMVSAATCGAKHDSTRHRRGNGAEVLAEHDGDDDEENKDEGTGCGAVLNVQTFADALTLDVRLYDVRNETRMTTNLDDVFLTHQLQLGKNKKSNVLASASDLQKLQYKNQNQTGGQQQTSHNNANLVDVDDEIDFRERLAKSHDIQRINTAPAIDVTAATYRSKGLMVCLWCTIILTYFCYWAGAIAPHYYEWNCEEEYLYSYSGSWRQNGKFVGCSLGQSIVRWILFFFIMSFYGLACVSLGSLGNSTQIKRPWWPLLGLLCVIMITFLPMGDEETTTPPEDEEQEASNITDDALGSNVTDDYFYFGNTTNTTEPTMSLLDISREESSGAMLRVITALMGTITAMFHLAHVLVLIVPIAWLECIPKAGRWITTGTVYAEMKMKRAAAFKLANMTQNALNVVKEKHDNRVIETHYGQALKNYEKYGKVYVRAGGFKWAWRILLGRKSFSREGIWLPARCVASNIAQFVMAIYILLAGCQLTSQVSNSYSVEHAKDTMDVYIDRFFDNAESSFIHNDLVQELMYNVTSTFSDFLSSTDNATNHTLSSILGCEDFPIITDIDKLLHTYCPPDHFDCNQTAIDAALLAPQLSNLCPLLANSSNTNVLNSSHVWALYMASGLDLNYLSYTVQSQLNAAAEKSIDSLYPAEKYMVVVPIAIGTAVAFTVAMYLALTYLPSVTTTFLQLRCGYIPTLHDKDFAFYRHAQDLVSILTGSLFWGTLVSSVVVGFIIAFITFIFLWQATIYFAQKLTAVIVGILCIAAIRMSCLCICRGTMYQAFYRTKPRAANYSLLALEWANLALSVGFVFMRMVKLLIVAGACIGKIDTEFLAQGIGKIGPIYLDAYPKIHRKDILAHEAHRHPYMEQLGVIYMMKLRYRHHFCNRAGSCWRLIFVYALMPWLHRYRVLAHPEQSERRRFSIIEAEHPDLQFVSLRKIDTGDDDEHDKTESARNDENIGRPELSSSMKSTTVHFVTDEDVDDKIQKLEAELEALRSKFRAAGIAE